MGWLLGLVAAFFAFGGGSSSTDKSEEKRLPPDDRHNDDVMPVGDDKKEDLGEKVSKVISEVLLDGMSPLFAQIQDKDLRDAMQTGAAAAVTGAVGLAAYSVITASSVLSALGPACAIVTVVVVIVSIVIDTIAIVDREIRSAENRRRVVLTEAKWDEAEAGLGTYLDAFLFGVIQMDREGKKGGPYVIPMRAYTPAPRRFDPNIPVQTATGTIVRPIEEVMLAFEAGMERDGWLPPEIHLQMDDIARQVCLCNSGWFIGAQAGYVDGMLFSLAQTVAPAGVKWGKKVLADAVQARKDAEKADRDEVKADLLAKEGGKMTAGFGGRVNAAVKVARQAAARTEAAASAEGRNPKQEARGSNTSRNTGSGSTEADGSGTRTGRSGPPRNVNKD